MHVLKPPTERDHYLLFSTKVPTNTNATLTKSMKTTTKKQVHSLLPQDGSSSRAKRTSSESKREENLSRLFMMAASPATTRHRRFLPKEILLFQLLISLSIKFLDLHHRSNSFSTQQTFDWEDWEPVFPFPLWKYPQWLIRIIVKPRHYLFILKFLDFWSSFDNSI